MKKPLLLLLAAIPCFTFGSSGRADVLYNNPVANDAYNCAFNTTCATDFALGNDYAAQLFALGGSSTINGASFSELDEAGTTPTDANWLFLAADGAGGTPGTILASGSSPILLQTSLGPDLSAAGTINQYNFDVTPLTLGAGSYYLAVQSVTDNFTGFLFEGAADSGSFETMDGGSTWTDSYQGLPSVAVGVYGDIPEPGSLVVLGTALAGLGATRRRRSKPADVNSR